MASLRGCPLRSSDGRRGRLLDERDPFLEAPLLAADALGAYAQPHVAAEQGTLFEHCLRAIDSQAQSWAGLSGAVPARHTERAIDAICTHLVRRGPQVLPLLTPPLDQSAQDPGYIKGYPPGVRENGGQNTHATVWIVMALGRLRSGDEAAEPFHMLNPISHTRTPDHVDHYNAEPYVIAGDVCANTGYAGRAGWMYRAGLDSILSLKPHGT